MDERQSIDWSGIDEAKVTRYRNVIEKSLVDADNQAEVIAQELQLEEIEAAHFLPREAYTPGMFARDVYGVLCRLERKQRKQ